MKKIAKPVRKTSAIKKSPTAAAKAKAWKSAYKRVVTALSKSPSKRVAAVGRRLALAKLPNWKETQITAHTGK